MVLAMVSTSVGFTVVLSRVGENNLARVMVLVNGEEGLSPVVTVGQDNGA